MDDLSNDDPRPRGFFSRLFEGWGIARFAVFFTLSGITIVMTRMSVDYWQSYQIASDGKMILTGFGVGFNFLEVWMLSLRAEMLRKGLRTWIAAWTIGFVCVVAVNMLTDTGAMVALTSGDTAHRAQAVRTYSRELARADDLERQVHQLPLSISDASLRVPSAALQPRLDEIRQRVAQYEDRAQPVPGAVLRRSGEIQSAQQIMQRVEALQAQIDSMEPDIDRTAPAPTLMQFKVVSDLAGIFGFNIQPEAAPMWVGLFMIGVAHFCTNVGLAIVTGHAGTTSQLPRLPWVDVSRWPYMRKATDAARSLLRRFRTSNDQLAEPNRTSAPTPATPQPPPRPRRRPSRKDDIHRDFDDFDG